VIFTCVVKLTESAVVAISHVVTISHPVPVQIAYSVRGPVPIHFVQPFGRAILPSV
jgi:hypothetical protein